MAKPENFGDQATADHIFINSGEDSADKDEVALVCFDRKHKWLQAYPDKTNSTPCVVRGLQHLFGHLKPKLIDTDNAKELAKACGEALLYLPDTSTPHGPQSNGVGEMAIRKVAEGLACIFQQSGMIALW